MDTNIIPETQVPAEDDSKTPSVVTATSSNGTPSHTNSTTPIRASSPTGNSRLHPQTTLPTTVHTSIEQTLIARFATVNAAAGLSDPFTLLTNAEKHAIPVSSITHEHLHAGNCARIRQKLSDGAIMVEAGDFAAVACWEPPASTAKIEASDGDLLFPAFAQRPMMHSYVHQSATWRRKALRGRDYWHLSLMARDPRRRDVKGAVRSVLEAGIWWAKFEGVPIWLEAGNQRAREVYAAFGFMELGVTWHGKEGAQVPIWMMIWEPTT